VTSRRIWAARGIALLADFIQLVLAPLFFEGGLSPFDAILDLSMASSWRRAPDDAYGD